MENGLERKSSCANVRNKSIHTARFNASPLLTTISAPLLVMFASPVHISATGERDGWAYNGKSAWKSVRERWANETSQWVGSNFFCLSCNITFANNPFQYKHHEEQYVTNPNDLILLNYHASTSIKQSKTTDPVIATYGLNYHKGKVIALGIYSDDIIANSKFNKFFDRLLVKYAPKSPTFSIRPVS